MKKGLIYMDIIPKTVTRLYRAIPALKNELGNVKPNLKQKPAEVRSEEVSSPGDVSNRLKNVAAC